MAHLLSQVAFDLARERTAEAERRARIHGVMPRRDHSVVERGRAVMARAAARVSLGSAAMSVGAASLARRIDACAASQVLVHREGRPTA